MTASSKAREVVKSLSELAVTVIFDLFWHRMNKILTFLTSLRPNPKAAKPTIESYGQETCGLAQDQIQSVMEWLFLSLVNAGYYGKSHIVWYDDSAPDPDLEQVAKTGIQRDEPTFLYRCGDRVQAPPDGYYWRLMSEHPSMRVYQLEFSKD